MIDIIYFFRNHIYQRTFPCEGEVFGPVICFAFSPLHHFAILQFISYLETAVDRSNGNVPTAKSIFDVTPITLSALPISNQQ